MAWMNHCYLLIQDNNIYSYNNDEVLDDPIDHNHMLSHKLFVDFHVAFDIHLFIDDK